MKKDEKDDEHVVNLTALIMNKDGKILIVKRVDNELAYPGKWAFPSCKVDKKETVMEALKKVIRKKTGLEIQNDKKFVSDYTFTRHDGKNIIGLCFLVKSKSENVKLSEEFQDFMWAGLRELGEYDHIPGMTAEMKIAMDVK